MTHLLLLAMTVLLSSLLGLAMADLENTNVIRTIDLASQLVRDSASITVTNKGTTPERLYEFAIEDPAHLALFEAQTKKGSKVLDHHIVTRG